MRHDYRIWIALLGSVAVISVAVLAQRPDRQSTRDCEAIASKTGWPAAGTRIVAALWRASGSPQQIPFGPPIALPEHCEVTGVVQERTGVDGQRYAIRFHLRLPSNWNGRFLFEGGGGTEGNVGAAVGMIRPGAPPAICGWVCRRFARWWS